MRLRSGKSLSKMSRSLVDNVNPQNNPQNVVHQPVVSMVKELVASTPVRTTTSVMSAMPTAPILSQRVTPPP